MLDPRKTLAALPASLRDPLVRSYHEIAANYTEHRWEPSELNGGKFCEVVYTIADGYISGAYPARPAKPTNMVDACRALEAKPAGPGVAVPRSLRILIPRMLPPLYEIRNNRGVGHVGGDVDPNFLDATAVYGMASWVLAELVRIFHNISTKEAQESVDALIERKHPIIWEIEDSNIKRILDARMPRGDQALVFLHQRLSWISESDLVEWVEYSNASVFRKKILEPLHKLRLIEYDGKASRVRISPLGVKDVEQRILKSRVL